MSHGQDDTAEVAAVPFASKSSLSSVDTSLVSRLSLLRGIRWRINLCDLRSSSIDDLRRITADSRRRYAALRRRLLFAPHVPKHGSRSSNLVVDNPLSDSPDSMWGHFFRGAELEKMVDQDLSRLYPEHGSYFQTSGCQSMLRRILLIWCLQHQQYGYRQGMHELLAPLLYVLHADLKHLSEVRKVYEDHFSDKFDDALFHEHDLTYNFDFKKYSDIIEDDVDFQYKTKKVISPNELDPDVQAVVLLSDVYGVEGELGVVLSEKFIEHDVYLMFDALMSGAGGAVAMAEFFAHSPGVGLHPGLPPVIEASSALYHLLSVVDSSVYGHLIELGVEPQYFALRWLRVLFGREFCLEALLVVWDEIFSFANAKIVKANEYDLLSSSGVLNSQRGAFISALGVSMILILRSSLLASETATSCLQRMLNFPGNVNLEKLMKKAKSLLPLALDVNVSSSSYAVPKSNVLTKSTDDRVNGHPVDSAGLKTPPHSVPESYWEEKWRDLQKEEELKRLNSSKQASRQKKGWTHKIKSILLRRENDPSPSERDSDVEDHTSVGRNLLEDLSKHLGDIDNVLEQSNSFTLSDPLQVKTGLVKTHSERDSEVEDHTTSSVRRNLLEDLSKHLGDIDNVLEQSNSITLSDPGQVKTGLEKTHSVQDTASEENFSTSDPPSPVGESNTGDNSEKSSFLSNTSSHDMNEESKQCIDHCESFSEEPSLPVSDPPVVSMFLPSTTTEHEVPSSGSSISGKFQWLWKFGRHAAGEGPSSDKAADGDASISSNGEHRHGNVVSGPFSEERSCKPENLKANNVDNQKLMHTLRSLGHSMLENIQVIESVFQQDKCQAGMVDNLHRTGLVDKGQVTALCAIKELRKISNLLSEM